MFRESVLAGSKQVDLIVSPLKGVAMQYRSATGGVSVSAGSKTGVAPGWVRLTRAGDVFTGYWSTDGVTFTKVGTITVPMNDGTSVGLAATSHNTAATTTAVFDNVAIVQP
jgi:regulation of enolase protein 1 (concanavalin A-like superfamily)